LHTAGRARPSAALLILVIRSMGLFIVGLDATILKVALLAIHRSFHSTASDLHWTIDAYTLVLASLLRQAVGLDRGSLRAPPRVPSGAAALLCVGSLLCALAPSFELLGRLSRVAGLRPLYVQRLATSRGCQRSNVPRVTRNDRQLDRGNSRRAAARKTQSGVVS
jgi:MFS family permease